MVIRNALRHTFRFRLPSYKMVPKEPQYLSVEEVKRLINTCPHLLEKTVVTLMFDAACRISEILNFKVEDIDWENLTTHDRAKHGFGDFPPVSSYSVATGWAQLDFNS